MSRGLFLAVLSLALWPVASSAQITGSGTSNQVPQFTSDSTIGDSPIRIGALGQVCFGDTQYCDEGVTRVDLQDFRLSDTNGNPTTTMSVKNACAIGHNCVAFETQTNGANSAAITATNYADGTTGGIGVYAKTVAPNSSTWGTAAVMGDFQGATGLGYGVVGLSSSLQGEGGHFASLAGNVDVGVAVGETSILYATTERGYVFTVNKGGDVLSSGGIRVNGTDYSTSLPVAGDTANYEPGDLLAIDPSAAGQLERAHDAYSSRVAGVYSTQPAVIANYGYPDLGRAGEVPMAIAGVVPCKVTAESGGIAPGDLLVSSSTPGYAMKGVERGRMLGAVVGKALEPLPAGRGVIKMLVTLQ